MGDDDQRRPFFARDLLRLVPERDDILRMPRADQLALIAELLADAESAHVPHPIEHLIDHAVAVRNIAEVQRVKDATGLRVASIYGSARLDAVTHPAAFDAVRRLASGLVGMGFVPLCGGGDGLMAAVSQGAHEGAEKLGRTDREAASFAINVILGR